MSDLISRADAIKHLKKRLYETALNNNTEHPYYEEIADNRIDVWMNEVPSAQPERKKGKWLITHDIGLTTAVCSECKYMIGHIEGCEYFRFCPSCGARLEVEDE